MGEVKPAAKTVLVCGSRDGWKRADYRELFNWISRLPKETTILHGDARGPDQVAGALARAFGMRVLSFPADWEREGRAAGVLRSNRMLDEKPDLVLAMWNGESRGTQHTIREAEKRGIAVEVIP